MVIQIISVVGAILMAIITAFIPIVQSLINKNNEERKIKIENLYKSKLLTFQDLMISFGHFRRNYRASVDEFLSCLCKATLYCDDDLKSKILLVIECLSSEDDYEKAYHIFLKIIPRFSTEIKTTQDELLYLNKNRSNTKDNTNNRENNSTENK